MWCSTTQGPHTRKLPETENLGLSNIAEPVGTGRRNRRAVWGWIPSLWALHSDCSVSAATADSQGNSLTWAEQGFAPPQPAGEAQLRGRNGASLPLGTAGQLSPGAHASVPLHNAPEPNPARKQSCKHIPNPIWLACSRCAFAHSPSFAFQQQHSSQLEEGAALSSPKALERQENTPLFHVASCLLHIPSFLLTPTLFPPKFISPPCQHPTSCFLRAHFPSLSKCAVGAHKAVGF